MGLLAILAATSAVRGQGEVRLSIPFTPPAIPEADLAVFEPIKTNLGPLKTDAVYYGKVYQYLSAAAGEKAVHRSAVFSLKPEKSGKFALFAGVNVQNQNFSSPLNFRLNDGSWQPVPEPASGSPRWGVSNAMAWTCLGTFDLAAGTDIQLEIGGDKPRAMDGRVAMYINGVLGFRVDALKSVQIDSIQVERNEINAGDTLHVGIQSPRPSETRGMVVELRYANSTVVQDFVRADAQGDTANVNLTIPFDAPTGEYSVSVQPQFYQRMSEVKSVAVLVRGAHAGKFRAIRSQAVASAKMNSAGHLHVQLSSAATTGTVIGAWLIDSRGYLLAAQDQNVPEGQRSAQMTLDSPRWQNLAGGRMEVFVHDSTTEPFILQFPGAVVIDAHKPMGNGVYIDEAQVAHRWYVTDDHTLVWDGKPWIPFGGMYCDPVLSFFSADPRARQKRMQTRRETLDAIERAGISAMYLNLAHGPAWARQAMVEELTRRGIYFGWQLNDAGKAFECYPIRSSAEQGLCVGQVLENGKLEVELPREQISGILTVKADSSADTRLVNVALDFNQPSGSDFIVMEGVKDQKKGFIKVRIEVPGLATGAYYVLPRIRRSGHMVDVWEQGAQIVKAHEWIRDIRWGPNLRFFIDPVVNEGGIYNGDESLRVWSDMFNREFSQWLANRYKNVRELERAWKLPDGSIRDFDQAAVLLPLRDRREHRSMLLWVDPVSQKVIATRGGPGAGWYDYQDAVRQSYARHRDQISAQVRQWVNVPIVFKRVTPWVCDETINRQVGGMNGIGVDIYPDKGSKLNSGLTAGSTEAELGAQTMWLMGAELGFNANPGNGNVRGFPSYDYMRDLTRASAAWGLKGFMYFGLRLEPSNLWGNMELCSLPDQMRWIIDIQKELNGHWPQRPLIAQSYPDGHSWWWRSGGEMLTKYSCVYDSAPGMFLQSFPLVADRDESRSIVAVNASQPMKYAQILLVNFRDADSVERFGPYVHERMESGTPMIYAGLWPAGAKLAGISEHFSSDGKYLIERPCDIILVRDNGKITGKQNGKLLLVAGEIKPPRTNSADTIEAIKKEWIDALLASSPKNR